MTCKRILKRANEISLGTDRRVLALVRTRVGSFTTSKFKTSNFKVSNYCLTKKKKKSQTIVFFYFFSFYFLGLRNGHGIQILYDFETVLGSLNCQQQTRNQNPILEQLGRNEAFECPHTVESMHCQYSICHFLQLKWLCFCFVSLDLDAKL